MIRYRQVTQPARSDNRTHTTHHGHLVARPATLLPHRAARPTSKRF